VDAQAQESQAADVQDQLLELLRTSPTLTMVVARDPSLLSDPAYVERNNPELAKFLAVHPEVARDPSYYLFSRLQGRPGRRAEALEQLVWPDLGARMDRSEGAGERLFEQAIGPGIMGLALIAAFLWLIRTLLENRRWNRMLRLQNEVHGKLIDRFGSSQELLAYMGTDAAADRTGADAAGDWAALDPALCSGRGCSDAGVRHARADAGNWAYAGCGSELGAGAASGADAEVRGGRGGAARAGRRTVMGANAG
jgi:hypothetical protein